jgi:hypothetical protein
VLALLAFRRLGHSAMVEPRLAWSGRAVLLLFCARRR